MRAFERLRRRRSARVRPRPAAREARAHRARTQSVPNFECLYKLLWEKKYTSTFKVLVVQSKCQTSVLDYCTVFINFFVLPQLDEGGGMQRDATPDDVLKIVEELARIH